MTKQASTFQAVLNKRLSRRNFLFSGSALAAASALPGCSKPASPPTGAAKPASLSFTELPQGLDNQLAVAPGYDYEVLIRWGDPLFSDAAEFNPQQQSAKQQAKQFGFNNDFIGFLPLPLGSQNSDHGLLAVNHEYTNPSMMFPGSPSAVGLDREHTDVDIVAHGLSVVEIKQRSNQWQVVKDSRYTRRITPYTPMKFSGAAAASKRLHTAISTDGVHTLGTYGNCAGGVTPWGTVLSGEENTDYMFAGDYSNSEAAESHQRFGMKAEARKSWAQHYARWDMSQQANEPLHMGWIVEIDPYEPDSVPQKHTALGRFKHEGCNVFINSDQRVVAYSGDDQRFEYLYKFVSKQRYQPDNRQANKQLLSEGTLYCAKFSDDGSLSWLPLVQGSGPLTAQNGFKQQSDVSIDTRKAADLLGATPMDRPEDVEVNPVNGRVYVMLTNNDERLDNQTDGVNPRANNTAGQIVELIPPGGDHSADTFSWEMLLLAGRRDEESTNYHPQTSDNGWLACPDNCAFDSQGNLWIATDGAENFGIADGIWCCEVEGENRALTKRFLRTPVGAELCGPYFTPDDKHLFCSIQHPGNSSSFENPSTRWPDFDKKLPPRPSVVVVSKTDGDVIGS
ncbi:MAG: PhoX family phosphatase [Cellvibrionaceae bacterium]|nr:PhoX family phosphatase [Cellvibrionaceae bacterium]